MSPRSAPHSTLAILGVLAVLLAGAATLRAAVGDEQGAGPALQLSSSGAVSLSNSKGGQAIFALENIGPGDSGQGEVTIANDGSAPGTLTLAASDLSDDPGTYGGALSERLGLRLTDLSSGAPTEVYSGPLGAMPELQLGTLAAGQARTYRFVVTMLEGGAPSAPWTDDNLYQRGSTSLGYEWTLTEVEGGGPESPEPPEPPTAPPVPPAVAPPPVVSEAPPPTPLLSGTSLADKLIGTSEDDVIRGRGGADRIWGRGGRDRLFGGAGADRIYGGPGADAIFARGGGADFVDCGSGRDHARVDERDRVKNCERITR